MDIWCLKISGRVPIDDPDDISSWARPPWKMTLAALVMIASCRIRRVPSAIRDGGVFASGPGAEKGLAAMRKVGDLRGFWIYLIHQRCHCQTFERIRWQMFPEFMRNLICGQKKLRLNWRTRALANLISKQALLDASGATANLLDSQTQSATGTGQILDPQKRYSIQVQSKMFWCYSWNFVNTFINFDARQTDQGWSRADLSLWIESKNLTHTPMPRWKQAQSELFTDNASLGLMKCGRAALQLVLRRKWYRILCLQRASVQKRLAQLDQGLHIRLFGQWCQVPIDSTNMPEKSWEQVKLHLSSLSCITHHNSPWIERWCHHCRSKKPPAIRLGADFGRAN